MVYIIKKCTVVACALLCVLGLVLAEENNRGDGKSSGIANPFPVIDATLSSDTLSVEDIEAAIVGTWIESTTQSDAQPQEWLFLEDGTLKQYADNHLYQTFTFDITEQCEDSFFGTLEASSYHVAMLELTDSNGTTSCKYITQWVEDHPERDEYFTLGTEYGVLLFERQ